MKQENISLEEMEAAILKKFEEKYGSPEKTKEIYEAYFGKGVKGKGMRKKVYKLIYKHATELR